MHRALTPFFNPETKIINIIILLNNPMKSFRVHENYTLEKCFLNSSYLSNKSYWEHDLNSFERV